VSLDEYRERKSIFLEDRVKGRRGVYIDLERVKPNEIDVPNLDKAYRVKYIPHVPANRSYLHRFLNLFYRILPSSVKHQFFVRMTDTVYPEAAIEGPRNVPTHGDGVPDEVIILHQDQYGDAPYADFIGESVERNLARQQQQAEDADREAKTEQLKNVQDGGSTNEVDRSPGRSPKDHSRRGGGLQ